MKTFVYLGKDAAGKRIHGIVDAPDLESARGKVEAEGKSITVIAESARMPRVSSVATDDSVDQTLETLTTRAEAVGAGAEVPAGAVEVTRMFNDLSDQAVHSQIADAPFDAVPTEIQLVEMTISARTVLLALGLLSAALFFGRARSRRRR